VKRIFALAIFFCAGCASCDGDIWNELFGDVGSFFSKHDTSSTSIPVPTPASMGYSTSTSSIAPPPQAPPSH
jgi:hypothetical protein